MFSFIGSIIIGGIAGWLAGLIRRGKGFGILTNIVVGIIGGFIGSLLLGLVGISPDNLLGNLVVSVLGAVIFLAILNFFKRDV